MVALAGSAQAATDTLKMQVLSDRLTLAVARYPQVYLYGTIDAGAPERFASLMTSGRIPAGSDIYLNARSGDEAAGMALGRMFRAGRMATHLGTPRQSRNAPASAKVAICVDACALAYFGGAYRWAPSGSDRMGFGADRIRVGGTFFDKPSVASYLKQMDIAVERSTQKPSRSAGEVVWFDADQMLGNGMANNGRLPVTAISDVAARIPTITLRQVDRNGAHRLSIQCEPGRTTVSAYDEVGRARAREVVGRGTHSYFQLDDARVLDLPRDGAGVDGSALIIRRNYPPADLVDLVSAWSFGAWVGGRTNAFRDGFKMPLQPVHKQLKLFYYACWRAAPWPARPKSARAKRAITPVH